VKDRQVRSVRHALTFMMVLAMGPLALVSQPAPAPAQNRAVEDHMAAIKHSLAESQVRLKHYEWIETQVVTVDGEESPASSAAAFMARMAACRGCR